MNELLNTVTSCVESKRLKLLKGDSFVIEEELLNSTVFVEDGSLILTKNERPILVRRNNEFADLFHLIHDQPKSFYEFIASTNMHIRVFKNDDLKPLLSINQVISDMLVRQLHYQMIEVEKMIQLQREPSETKRLLKLIDHIQEVGQSNSKGEILESNLKWIASMSNVSLRFTKKIINKLENRNLLAIETGRMIIKDRDALKLLIKKAEFL
ncbi:MAG: Crp/Fnr family transcriptional regulator [Crocinitomicaceae bacterium]|nr:Crp/Fnr family transcriptional regulator [Crocinitomicaceae bacterium]